MTPSPRKRASVAVLASVALVLGLGVALIPATPLVPAETSEQAQAAYPYAAGWGPKVYAYRCIYVSRHVGPDRTAYPNLKRGSFREYWYNESFDPKCVVENWRIVYY